MKFPFSFTIVAQWISNQSGRPLTFGLATAVIAIWAISGPIFQYSDTWQLIINTGTTVITFLMVFLIQNTQNRDSAAVQLKLDELIRATGSARNSLLMAENLPEKELDELRQHFAKLAESGDADIDQLCELSAELKSGPPSSIKSVAD